MVSHVLLLLLVPVALGRVAFHLHNLEKDITLCDMKEIEQLHELTQKLEDLGTKFKNPIEDILNIEEDDVIFYVYSKEKSEPVKLYLSNATKITSLSSFDTNLDTIFIVHGWHNDFSSDVNVFIREGYLKVRNVNIIVVDWNSLAKGLYALAFRAVPYVGQYVGQFIQNISLTYKYPLDKISLVGHSLGAHISGFAGQETKGGLSSITGLDPAGPLFFQSSPDKRLSEDDAQYVQSIHSNAGLLGVSYSVAIADFWPNGGGSQPGCKLDVTGSCAHSRSYLYFAESLNSNSFIAKKCDDYDNYEDGKCIKNTSVVMGGADVNTKISGNYYLKTNTSSPFALGDIGL